MKRRAFWWDIDESLEPSKTYELPKQSDFVIVGGGYTGLSAGLTIARQGKSVVVLDSGKPGLGASTRNGGICSGQIRLSHSSLCHRFSKEFADEVYLEGVEARFDLSKFCLEENIDCQLKMSGRFTGAMSEADYYKQSKESERLNKLDGHKTLMVSKADQHNEISTDLFFGGMLREEIGGFHPGKFFAGLLKCSEGAGVNIISDTPVLEIKDISEGKKSVVTKRGSISTGKVIVATNAYTGTKHRVGKFLRRRLVPAQSAIIVTEKLGVDRVKEMMPKLRMYGNTANLYSYFRPTPDHDRILLGSRGFDKLEATDRTVKYLKQKLSLIFPDLLECKIDYCWQGNVGFTRTQLPVIFEYNDIYYAAGYAGSGTVWARWMGKKVAETAMRTANKPSIFYGEPPKSIPFYDGNPWFLPSIQYYYALKDWLKFRH